MERESGLVLRSSGVALDWRTLGENPHASYNEVVMTLTFKGACKFDPATPIHRRVQPLG